MHKHSKHDHCPHPHLTYCSQCACVHCLDCKREWRDIPTVWYLPRTTWGLQDYSYTYTTTGAPVTNSLAATFTNRANTTEVKDVHCDHASTVKTS